MSSEGFSIILCTYNGVPRLLQTLQHLASLKIPGSLEIELVVVNNASTDDTENYATTTWNELGKPYCMRLINEKRPGKGYAVETGYDAANYSYLLTVDDDNWLASDYLVEALELFKMDEEIGVLQGKSIGVFESQPPEWIKKEGMEHFFVIGGPINNTGYFPQNNFGTWGAGMVIKKKDWDYLRSFGFAFLTSKVPGKAAGEDHELARALLMIGKKFYYSDKLVFQHYMPAERVTWSKLKQNFETFGYVSHYNFLFALVLDAQQQGYDLGKTKISKKFLRYIFKSLNSFSLKQHAAYWVSPQEEYYQLKLVQYFSHLKWFYRLKSNLAKDIRFLQTWMIPILNRYPGRFQWPGHMY